jgi:hypothetical protein
MEIVKQGLLHQTSRCIICKLYLSDAADVWKCVKRHENTVQNLLILNEARYRLNHVLNRAVYFVKFQSMVRRVHIANEVGYHASSRRKYE